MRQYLLLLGSGFLLLTACESTGTPENTSPKPSDLEIQMQTLERSVGDCESEDKPCASVILEYPMVSSTEHPQLAQQINDAVQQNILRVIAAVNPIDSLPDDLDACTKMFLADYQDFVQDVPTYTIPWTIETESQVLLNAEKILSLDVSSFTYTGGAHPNNFTWLYNVQLPGGEPLLLESLILNETAFLTKVENQFKQSRGLEGDADLAEMGFSFGDAPFALPENYGFTAEGIYFYYNAYEVGPYVVGPTEFTILYSELTGLIDKSSLF